MKKYELGGHVARVDEMRKAWNISVRQPEERRLL
jgi:hypothetical protein